MNIQKIEKLMTSKPGDQSFTKTLGNLIFSANNPFQEGQAFVSSDNVQETLNQ